MSKSSSTIKAKPFVQEKESDKAARKLETRIEHKLNILRRTDKGYDLRRALQMKSFGCIYE